MFELELDRDSDKDSFLIVSFLRPTKTLPEPKVTEVDDLFIFPKGERSPALVGDLGRPLLLPATAHPSAPGCEISLRSPPRQYSPRDMLICRWRDSFSCAAFSLAA